MIETYLDIPKFTQCHYTIDTPWWFLENWIKSRTEDSNLDLDPDFQRAHVWNDAKRIAYVEFILRGGKSGRDIYFNCPNWQRLNSTRGQLVLVDGKQRIEAVRKFLRNEIKAFGRTSKDLIPSQWITATVPFDACFKFHVADLSTRKQVLEWYLELNSGGVVHTAEELQKVKNLIANER